MKSPSTILFSVTNLELGGAQMFVLRLASFLKEKGHAVIVYNHGPEWSNPEFINEFKEKLTIVSYSENRYKIFFIWKINAILKKLRLKSDFRNEYNYLFFKKYVIKNNISVINSQMQDSDYYVSRLRAELPIKFILTTHGEYELLEKTQSIKYNPNYYQAIIEKADAIIYTADKNIEAIKPYIASNCPVKKIYVGFDPRALPNYNIDFEKYGIKKEDFVIGQVARGIPEKGWENFIEMATRINAKTALQNIQFICIGDGEYLKQLCDKVQFSNFRLIQFQSNPLAYYSWVKRFNIGLLLSHFEGESVPNSVIEYLFNGIPVIATSIGEIPEMIKSRDGMAGYTIKLTNGVVDMNELCDRIEFLIQNRTARENLINNTSKASEKFDMNVISDNYLDVFNRAKL